MSQAFDSLLAKIENYYSDSDYTTLDAEHLSRIAIAEYADTKNGLVASARKLPSDSVQRIIDASIDKNIAGNPTEWMLFAANAVDNVLNYSHHGLLASGLGEYTDFLPVGHPSRTNRGAMTASALNHATALWTAADPRVATDEARYDIYKAYSSTPGSIESEFASLKLSALVAGGYVPEDIILPITAAFRMSFAMRSAMSKALAAVRRRHRDGRFAEEFGRLKGFFSRPDGSIFSESGRIVGAQANTNNFLVEYKDSDEIPDGVYVMDAAKTDPVKAILSKRATKGTKSVRSIETPTQAEKDAAIPLDEFLATRQEAPEGWTKNEDGSFTSKTGQTLRQVDARPEGDYMFEGAGESGAQDPDEPLFELRDIDNNVIGVAQDWAGANKIAMTYDALEDDTADAPGLDQDASKDPGTVWYEANKDWFKALDFDHMEDDKNWTGSPDKYEYTSPDGRLRMVEDPDGDVDDEGNEFDASRVQVFYDGKNVGSFRSGPLTDRNPYSPTRDQIDISSVDFGEGLSDAFAEGNFKPEDATGLDQDSKKSSAIDMEHLSDPDNWREPDWREPNRKGVYESPDGRLFVNLEGDVDGNYLVVTFDGKDLEVADEDVLRSLVQDLYDLPYKQMSKNDVQKTVDEIAEMLDEAVKDADSSASDIGPDLERTDSGDLEYYSDDAGADISKVGDKWQLVKTGFLEAEEITGPWSDGQHQYKETKMFDSEEEAIAEAQKWIDLGKSPEFYDFMYNDWFDGQADGLDQDANKNWADEAIDFDALDNQDNWKDIGGGSEEYTSPDGKLKLTFEPDGDSDGEGGIVDASGISIEYDGQYVGSFKATARDLTSPGAIADALSVAIGDSKFNPNNLVKADDSGEYEFLSDIGNVGSVSIVKKYDPNTKKLQWEVTREASNLIDENIEHSYFEQKKFDSLDDARAFAEEFAQILNDDDKYSKFLYDDWADRDYDYGFDQAGASVPDSVKQLADGYNISPRVETVYNSKTKQFEREENPNEFESDGDFYDFGSAVVNLSEYAPGKWVATVFYGDNDGSGQNVRELEESFDSPEEAFEWAATGFGRQLDNSQVAEGIIKRNSSVEMLDFLNSPKYKEVDESYQKEISEMLSYFGFDQAAGTDEIEATGDGNASYKGSDGATGSIKSDGSGTWEGSFTDAEGEVSTRKFKAEDKAAAWLQKKVDDSKLTAFKKENGGLSPKQLEPATSKQYDLLQELFDERDDIDSTTSQAIKDALDNRNLSKSQISALFGDLQKKPFKPGVDSTKPTDRMLSSLQGYLTTKQISKEEMDGILDQLEAGLDRAGIEALTNKLRRKPDNADAPGLDQSAPELSEQEIDQKIDDLASDDDYYGLVEIAQDYDVSEEQSDRALRELERIKDEYDAREASAEEDLNAALEASLDEARSDFESAKNDLDVELANGQSDQEEYENQLEELKRELDEFETNYERPTWRGSELGSRSGMLENANGTREAGLRAYEDWQSSERADLSGERPGLDQNAPESFSSRWENMDDDEKQEIVDKVSDYLREWEETNPRGFYREWAPFTADSYYNPDGERALEKFYNYADNYIEYLIGEKPDLIDPFMERVDGPGLDQDAATKPLTEKQLEPASDAQYNYLQNLVDSKVDVDSDTAAAVAEAAANKNLSKAQAGALIGKLRNLADKENAGQLGKPSPKMIDSVNRDVYAKGLSEEDRNEILKDLDSLSKADVSSIISQLKEMPNVPGGLDNYIKALVEDGNLEKLKSLKADVRNEDSFSVLDKAINSLETGEDSGLDQAAAPAQASGPLFDKDEVSSLLKEIREAEESGEIGNNFIPPGMADDFDPESVGDAAMLYSELKDANVGSSGTLGEKLTEITKNLLDSIKSKLGPVEFAKRDSDDLGSSSKFDSAVGDLNDFLSYYYPTQASSDMEIGPEGGRVGDVRGGGWEASVKFNEETKKWEANLTSPGQDSESYSQEFDDQEDAAEYVSNELEKNNYESVDVNVLLLSRDGLDSLVSEYGDNPEELNTALAAAMGWLMNTNRAQADEIAKVLDEVAERLGETSAASPKA